MPRSVALFVSSYWRLGWLLAVLLWATEFRPCAATIRSTAVGTVMRAGSSHASATSAVELLKQNATCWEAIASSETDAGSWLPIGTALLPPLAWHLTDALTWPVWPNLRFEVAPVVFRQQLFLVAVLPNAP